MSRLMAGMSAWLIRDRFAGPPASGEGLASSLMCTSMHAVRVIREIRAIPSGVLVLVTLLI